MEVDTRRPPVKMVKIKNNIYIINSNRLRFVCESYGFDIYVIKIGLNRVDIPGFRINIFINIKIRS